MPSIEKITNGLTLAQALSELPENAYEAFFKDIPDKVLTTALNSAENWEDFYFSFYPEQFLKITRILECVARVKDLQFEDDNDLLVQICVINLLHARNTASQRKFMEEIHTLIPMKNIPEIKEMGHILGIGGKFHELWSVELANTSLKARFEALNRLDIGQKGTLHLDLVSDSPEKFLAQVTESTDHGALYSLHARFDTFVGGHVFSCHFVRDGDTTHIIYVNRGDRTFMRFGDEKMAAVEVYSIQDHDMLKQHARALYSALQSEDLSKIMPCLQALRPHLNQKLTKTLAKSDQKVENCTISNANIAWNYHLASLMMHHHPTLSFEAAYIATRKDYKAMRMDDRAKAFCDLITHLKGKYTREINFKEAVYQVMYKMTSKDLKAPERQTVVFLLNKLLEQPHGEEHLQTFFTQILNNEFKPTFSTSPTAIPTPLVQLQWAEATHKLLPPSAERDAKMHAFKVKCLGKDEHPSNDMGSTPSA